MSAGEEFALAFSLLVMVPCFVVSVVLFFVDRRDRRRWKR